MQDDELRAIQLADPLRLKRLHLTPQQYDILTWVISKEGAAVRSVDLKEYIDVSIKTASGLLLGLYHHAYLSRTETIKKSGGIEYAYQIKRSVLKAYHEAQE